MASATVGLFGNAFAIGNGANATSTGTFDLSLAIGPGVTTSAGGNLDLENVSALGKGATATVSSSSGDRCLR